MSKLKSRLFILLLVFGRIICCFAQNSDGTNLSSLKPFYGDPRYHDNPSEQYFISFKTRPEVIRSLVPEPLIPLSDEMHITFARLRLISPIKLDYNEVYLLTPAALGTVFGAYLPVLYLDKVKGIIPGRELAGYNKVGAEIQFKENDDNTLIRVTQRDTLIMKASFALVEPFTPKEEP